MVTIRGLSIGFVIGASILSAPAPSEQSSAVPRIGVLINPANASLEEGLRDGLRDLGYLDGKNIVIEWRRSARTAEELGALAADLARSKVDLIVASGSPAARAALAATTLPVVFAPVGDPVATGFAVSLARPERSAHTGCLAYVDTSEPLLDEHRILSFRGDSGAIPFSRLVTVSHGKRS